MYQPQLIQDAFIGLVRLRQTDNPDFPQLSSVLTSGTGLLIEHPLLNIENIDMTARNYAQYNHAAYNGATTYLTGARVVSAGIVYESKVDNNLANTPASSPVQWKVVDLLSLHLEDVLRSSIDQVVERVFDEKKLRGESKTVLETVRAMDAVGTFDNLVVNAGNLVGVEIRLKHQQNIVALIEQIGIQLSQSQAELNLYVYHSSQYEPIATITIAPNKPNSFQWFKPSSPVILHHLTSSYAAGGSFYIMYDQDELSGQALNAHYNFANAPCSCNPYAFKNWNLMAKYVSVRAVYIPALYKPVDPSTTMFSLANIKSDNQPNNWGLNFDISVKCDLTEFLIRQKSVFASAIRDMFIVKMLDQIRNSTRQNGVDEKTKQLAAFALQSRQVGGGGMVDDLNRKLKAIDFEIADLDHTCMPCANRRGVRQSSFGLWQ